MLSEGAGTRKRKNLCFLVYLWNLLEAIGKESGGETGIRTLEGVAPLPVFKTGAFNRSAISPQEHELLAR